MGKLNQGQERVMFGRMTLGGRYYIIMFRDYVKQHYQQ